MQEQAPGTQQGTSNTAGYLCRTTGLPEAQILLVSEAEAPPSWRAHPCPWGKNNWAAGSINAKGAPYLN